MWRFLKHAVELRVTVSHHSAPGSALIHPKKSLVFFKNLLQNAASWNIKFQVKSCKHQIGLEGKSELAWWRLIMFETSARAFLCQRAPSHSDPRSRLHKRAFSNFWRGAETLVKRCKAQASSSAKFWTSDTFLNFQNTWHSGVTTHN